MIKPLRLCGARLSRDRGRCRANAIEGRRRCRWHGGRSTGPRTPLGKAHVVASMKAGRAKYIERMHLAIRMGLATRFPCGRKPGASKTVYQARQVIAEIREELAIGHSDASDQLKRLVSKSLDVLGEILDLPVPKETTDKKWVLKLQGKTAQGLINTQIRVDDTELRARRVDRLAPTLAALLEENRRC